MSFCKQKRTTETTSKAWPNGRTPSSTVRWEKRQNRWPSKRTNIRQTLGLFIVLASNNPCNIFLVLLLSVCWSCEFLFPSFVRFCHIFDIYFLPPLLAFTLNNIFPVNFGCCCYIPFRSHWCTAHDNVLIPMPTKFIHFIPFTLLWFHQFRSWSWTLKLGLHDLFAQITTKSSLSPCKVAFYCR